MKISENLRIDDWNPVCKMWTVSVGVCIESTNQNERGIYASNQF